jgi:hypothetical protein
LQGLWEETRVFFFTPTARYIQQKTLSLSSFKEDITESVGASQGFKKLREIVIN